MENRHSDESKPAESRQESSFLIEGDRSTTTGSELHQFATTITCSVDLGSIESNRRSAEALINDEDSEEGPDVQNVNGNDLLNMTAQELAENLDDSHSEGDIDEEIELLVQQQRER